MPPDPPPLSVTLVISGLSKTSGSSHQNSCHIPARSNGMSPLTVIHRAAIGSDDHARRVQPHGVLDHTITHTEQAAGIKCECGVSRRAVGKCGGCADNRTPTMPTISPITRPRSKVVAEVFLAPIFDGVQQLDKEDGRESGQDAQNQIGRQLTP